MLREARIDVALQRREGADLDDRLHGVHRGAASCARVIEPGPTLVSISTE
jgi:hypothetical protein